MKKHLTEEINRIKSLFGENRLYGNVVREAPEEGSDMVGLTTDHEVNIDEAPEEGSDMVGLDSNHEPEDIAAVDVVNGDQQTLAEGLGVNANKLVSVYKKYNDMGSTGTFNEIFKTLREKGKQPYTDFSNGCATKVSLALQAAGKNVPAGFRVQDGPMKGKTIQTSAQGLSNKLGKPDLSFTGDIDADKLSKMIGEKTGVLICASCGFGSGVSGHATLYQNGDTVDYSSYHLDNPSAEIKFWEV
tara:strand:+ start:1223 stop:1954 length:732 start_codon:yes stop_codon:yes gene_type:complete